MSAARKIWKIGWRLAVCTLLMAWILQAIFQNEGRLAWQRQGHSWSQLSRTQQWRAAWWHGPRELWHTLTLVSTLSPCVMCTGTALLYRIPRVIIGENRTFMGAEDLFAARGVECVVLQDEECIELMRRFIAEHPALWNEDIGVPAADERR